MKEASARIKINKLLEAAGWRFFAGSNGPANIQIKSNVTIQSLDLDELGSDFENVSIDYLSIVFEEKSTGHDPLVGKEQARTYARAQNCGFTILCNMNKRYFWDIERGSPYLITAFPTPDAVQGYQEIMPNPNRLTE